MIPVPRKPQTTRPPGSPPPEAACAGNPAIWKRPASCGKGLLGSVGFHVCAALIACAFTLTHNGGGTDGDTGSTQEDPGFQSTRNSWSPPDHPMKVSRIPDTASVRRSVTSFPGLASPVSIPSSEPMRLVTSNLAIPAFPSSVGSVAEVSSKPATSGEKGTSTKPRKARSGDGLATRKKPAPAPPTLIKAPPPRYPADARASRITGKAAVLIRVLRDGSAGSTSLYRSSGNGDLDRAAVAAAREWKFSPTPSLENGETVSVVVNVTFAL